MEGEDGVTDGDDVRGRGKERRKDRITIVLTDGYQFVVFDETPEFVVWSHISPLSKYLPPNQLK